MRMGRYEEAETAARELVEKPQFAHTAEKHSIEASMALRKVNLGEALLGADRRLEALAVLREAEKYYRGELAKGATETSFRQDFSRALDHLARAQTDDASGRVQRVALLSEAASLLDEMSIEARLLRPSKELIKWVTAARREALAAGN